MFSRNHKDAEHDHRKEAVVHNGGNAPQSVENKSFENEDNAQVVHF